MQTIAYLVESVNKHELAVGWRISSVITFKIIMGGVLVNTEWQPSPNKMTIVFKIKGCAYITKKQSYHGGVKFRAECNKISTRLALHVIQAEFEKYSPTKPPVELYSKKSKYGDVTKYRIGR